METKCPFCETGNLTPSTRTRYFGHSTGEIPVDGLEGYVCDNCPSQPIFPDQIKRNQERVAAARLARDTATEPKR
jgi:hypothetical protein